MAKEYTLPSGALLKITLAPFVDAKALKQAVLREFKEIRIPAKDQEGGVWQLLKDAITVGFSSSEVEQCLWKCFERCTYTPKGGAEAKVMPDSFEPEEARQDYVEACIQVVKENIFPFVKSLYSEFKKYQGEISSSLE